jgi:predicted YcjX-like family ATPase
VTNRLTDFLGEVGLGARALLEFGHNLFQPHLRLGITGLSRSGKTVFITALVHGLIRGGRFPVFEAMANGRISGARLSPQPDDAVPRFQYEQHIADLVEARRWPDSTRQISELRLAIDYQSRGGTNRTLTLDIVDYPGEWLLDLPLLTMSYEEWARDSLARSRETPRAALAKQWHAHLAMLDPLASACETDAIEAAKLFTAYLRACRDESIAMSVLPPGRFLMPGDLEGSPALTFAPLELPSGGEPQPESLWAMMRRRYEAYKELIVRPFFNDHFLRLDRQIVLVDALAALNAGPDALRDLESAVGNILDCFNVGRRTLWSAMWQPRADRILFAATKADHLHQDSHEMLEALLRRITRRAAERAQFSGATIDVAALAAVRATHEAQIRSGRDSLPAIVGVPLAGDTVNGRVFDGETEVATFPGDTPENLDALFTASDRKAKRETLKFVRFRPPHLERDGKGAPALPHIRLDRVLQFLIGDRLQ